MKHTNFIKDNEVLLKVDFIFEPIKEISAVIRIKDCLYRVEKFCDDFPGHPNAHIRHVFLIDCEQF